MSPNPIVLRLPKFLRARVRRVVVLSLVGVMATGAAVFGAPLLQTAAPATYSLWADSVTPTTPTDPEVAALELGTQFTSSQAGQVSSVRFYKSATNTGVHTGSLWDSHGRRLAKVTFTGETASGWQRANFATPVSVSAGSTYVVSYTTNGHYADDQNYFASGKTRSSGPLKAVAGVYVYGSGMPSNQWRSSNYYVDVVFTPSATSSTSTTTSTTSTTRPPTSTTTTSTTTSTTRPPPSTTSSSTRPPTSTSTSTRPPSSSSSTTTPPSAAPTGCVSLPSSCGYPDASNTGVQAGVALRSSGCPTAGTAGQVIENVTLVDCAITVTAPNVTIRNIKILTTAVETWALRIAGNGSATISYVEISGRDKNAGSVEYAILNQTNNRVTIDHANLHHCADCVQGEAITLTNSYIHDLANPPSAHADGFLCNAQCGVTVRHNTILNEWSQTSAIALFGDFGTPVNSIVDNNLLAGGGYTLYGGTDSSTGIQITNNRFASLYYPQAGQFGPVTALSRVGSANVFSGNIWDSSGKPILAP